MTNSRAKIEKIRYYSCSHCGFSPKNRAGWCAKGCGSDYNTMHDDTDSIEALLGEARSTAVKQELERLNNITHRAPGFVMIANAIENRLAELTKEKR